MLRDLLVPAKVYLHRGHVRHINHTSRLAIVEGPGFTEACIPSHELGLSPLLEGARVVFQVTKRADVGDGKRMEGKRAWSLQLGPFVYTPFRKGIGFSKRITKEAQAILRERYHAVWPQDAGLLIRSSIAHYDEAKSIAILQALHTWHEEAQGSHISSLETMYVAQLSHGSSVVVDDAQTFNRIKHYAARMRPDIMVRKGISFEDYHEEAWEALFSTHVPLLGGGVLIVEEVAALVAIDINKAGCTDAWVTFHKRAFEAAGAEIIRRDLGGLIVIDPAGRVKDPSAVSAIVAALNKALSLSDRPYRLLGWSGSGLFELTREKRGPSLVARLTAGGATLTPSLETQCGEVLRAVKRKNNDGGAPSVITVPAPLYHFLHDKGLAQEPGSLVIFSPSPIWFGLV